MKIYFFCKLGQTACFLFPDCFGPGGGRTISSYFIVSLKKSARWLKGLCGGLNVEGIGESNRQLQLKR